MGRLYYDDSYQREFTARVVRRSEDGRRVVLDATAFYPTSGGQPHDTGSLGGARVLEVVEDGDEIVHVTDAPLDAADPLTGQVEWTRRFDHMQQHTGQHLLSAVLQDEFGMRTLSFHLGEEVSTIEIESDAASAATLELAERRCNELVFTNRPVLVEYVDAAKATGLRKPPDRPGLLRIVVIDGVDRSACGGTHVRRTGEIGPVLLRGAERLRDNLRVEFVCGMRAVRQARADYLALSRVARVFSAPLNQVPELVEAQLRRLQEAEKAVRRLSTEVAQHEARLLHAATEPGADGIRRVLVREGEGSLSEQLRLKAQALTALGRAVLLGCSTGGQILLAASADCGVHAGNVLREALQGAGGRGGGGATMAQGTVPSDRAEVAVRAVAERIGLRLE